MAENQNKHKHLTDFERGMIKVLHEQGYSPYAIGKELGRASNTIRNELKRGIVHQYDSRRNKDLYIYFPEAGYARYKKNRCKSVHHYKKDSNIKVQEFIGKVEDIVLNKGYSLDSALHLVLQKENYSKEDIVCVRTLYNYVEHGIIKIKNIDLPCKVSRKQKKEKREPKREKRQFGTSIEKRDEDIDKREEFGHYEIDLIIGKKQNDEALLTLTERKTRYDIIRKVPSKKAEDINACLEEILKEIPRKAIKTITSDNGSEFSRLYEMEKGHGIYIYYAHPYSSYERGSNENANRLVRRHAKKGKPIAPLSDEDIQYIEDWMNKMPRRLLGYQSAEELYRSEIERLTG